MPDEPVGLRIELLVHFCKKIVSPLILYMPHDIFRQYFPKEPYLPTCITVQAWTESAYYEYFRQ